MSAPINDGGPAFPVLGQPVPGGQKGELMGQLAHGMTLRDYFAGQALQQFVSQRDHNVWAHERYAAARIEIARAAYNIADAMIAARGGAK